MARCKINLNAICSSKNYKQSKRLHANMLKQNHKVLIEALIKEEIVIKKRPYVKVFGNLMTITPDEVTTFEKEMTIIWL